MGPDFFEAFVFLVAGGGGILVTQLRGNELPVLLPVVKPLQERLARIPEAVHHLGHPGIMVWFFPRKEEVVAVLVRVPGFHFPVPVISPELVAQDMAAHGIEVGADAAGKGELSVPDLLQKDHHRILENVASGFKRSTMAENQPGNPGKLPLIHLIEGNLVKGDQSDHLIDLR